MNVVIRDKLCLCCGAKNARLYRKKDGRFYSACQQCSDRCAGCVQVISECTESDWSELMAANGALFPGWV